MIGDLTENNCRELTGLSFVEVLGISGIYGIHSKKFVDKLSQTKEPHFLATYSDESVLLEFSTYLIKDLHVRIDFNHRTITNILFIIHKRGQGLGFSRLCSQVKYAKSAGFRMIMLTAWGDYKTIKKYVGYIVWGKYGFLMAEGTQKENFLKLMAKYGRDNKLLYDFLQTDVGLKIWRKEGFYWYGEFDLSDESISMMILQNEINKGRKVINP